MYPNHEKITDLIHKLRQLLFPEHFGNGAGTTFADIRDLLKWQTKIALSYRKPPVEGDIEEAAEKILDAFFEKLPALKEALLKDAQAGLDGDPAANSVDEIILAYPGFFAIFVYRFAHELNSANVPLIPRMMSEYAHTKTGIDIHPGAAIGERFFIDHGTGVVIGETSNVGNNVKLYQGVTIGALSTKNAKDLFGKKRHPTIEDDVVIYACAAVLGGNTVIGKGSTIGGNSFITESVAPNSKISGGGMKNSSLR